MKVIIAHNEFHILASWYFKLERDYDEGYSTWVNDFLLAYGNSKSMINLIKILDTRPSKVII